MNTPSLTPEDIDKLGLTVLHLSQELWTVIERQRLLEHAIEQQGLSVSELIENHRPEGELAERIESERRRFIDRIVTNISGQSNE